MNDTKCLFCGSVIPEGRQVCPVCERKAVSGKLNRADLRRLQRTQEKQKRTYTVTEPQLNKMVKTAALELLEKGIREYRDNEIQMLREDIRKIHSLNLAIYRNILFDMGLLNRDNAEEFVTRTNAAWDEIDRLIENGNMHELQKYAESLGADEDTFMTINKREGEPEEIAEIILQMEDES